ncbi:hypothetical protein [Herbaspirillum camelliae]|uniref:hypothetical protein n=1 Tax=Herbaspirillum camelliae TaxID=1892903 RepID=UPI000949E541|nr:hypothetical protein [Herbaspirillum camelliae]
MSFPFSAELLSSSQARADAVGYLALIYVGKRLPLQVCHSAAGHYIGTTDAEGPVSRESVQYFRSYQTASQAMTTGHWQQRLYP